MTYFGALQYFPGGIIENQGRAGEDMHPVCWQYLAVHTTKINQLNCSHWFHMTVALHVSAHIWDHLQAVSLNMSLVNELS
jgi:hypothetical protein